MIYWFIIIIGIILLSISLSNPIYKIVIKKLEFLKKISKSHKIFEKE